MARSDSHMAIALLFAIGAVRGLALVTFPATGAIGRRRTALRAVVPA